MEIDAVVTDIDGVLIDTSESYHRAIIESVRTVYGETIERNQTQSFKNAGGFNNDWVTTDAVALFILAQRHEQHLTVNEFTDAIANRGGGLEGAKKALQEHLHADTFEAILDMWDPTELRRTFQWLYLGPDRYAEFEDEPAPRATPHPAGFITNEPVIIESRTQQLLAEHYQLGVLTGRPKQEAEVALSRLELDLPPDRVITMDDWEAGKPDPEGLLRIANAYNARHVAYVGDELDDIRTAVRADEADVTRSVVGIGVLTGGLRGEAGRNAFSAVGAEAILDSVNALPELLSS